MRIRIRRPIQLAQPAKVKAGFRRVKTTMEIRRFTNNIGGEIKVLPADDASDLVCDGRAVYLDTEMVHAPIGAVFEVDDTTARELIAAGSAEIAPDDRGRVA